MREKPVVDVHYAEKHSSHIALPGGRHAADVRTLCAASDGTVYAGTALWLFGVRQSFQPDRPIAQLMPEWQPESEVWTAAPEREVYDVRDVRLDETGRVWACGQTGVFRLQQGSWVKVCDPPDGPYISVVLSVLPTKDSIWIATSHAGVGRVENGAFVPLRDQSALPGMVWRLDPGPDGAVWAVGSGGATLIGQDGEAIGRSIRGVQVRRVVDQGGVTIAATSDGVMFLAPGGTWGEDQGAQPVRDMKDALLAGDGSLWAATPHGVWRRRPDGRVAYYGGKRWLPSDDARALAEGPDGTIWVATAAGLAHLAELSSTLEDKAHRFDARIEARHVRLGGFVTSSRLLRPGDLSSNQTRPSDNDGLWTCMHLAAQSYRYAATKDPDAKAKASRSYRAVEWLEAVTGISGFPTKAILPMGEPPNSGEIRWHPSPDGKWLWKGDCSSDEIVGHFYGYSIFYDLAADEEEKARVRALTERIMDHILDHGYYQMLGGKPTRWGVWAPEKLNDDPEWRAERGLNSLEILSHLRAAYHITGKERYIEAYHTLINKHGYAENMRRQKIDAPGHDNHSDDELAFLSYYPLLKYEDDPALRSVYLESLERAWQVEAPERNPLWNLIYGVSTKKPCDLDAAVRTLREIPLDLIDWSVKNSHRADVELDFMSGRFGELQSVHVLPYDELPALKWNGNPYRLDDGGGGHSEGDGVHFILPYWMARYYGYIVAETEAASE